MTICCNDCVDRGTFEDSEFERFKQDIEYYKTQALEVISQYLR